MDDDRPLPLELPAAALSWLQAVMTALQARASDPRAKREGRQTTRPRRSTVRSRMSQKGHEDPFPPLWLNVRCVIRHGTFAETNGNGRDAPEAVIGGSEYRPSLFDPSFHGGALKNCRSAAFHASGNLLRRSRRHVIIGLRRPPAAGSTGTARGARNFVCNWRRVSPPT